MIQLLKIGLESVEDLRDISCETYYDTFKDSIVNPDDMDHFLRDAYSLETLSQELENPESEFFFLYADKRLVGYLKLNVGAAQTEADVAENTLEIQRIYVRPSEKRQGFGTILMDFAMKHAKEAGYDSVWLGVWEHNDAAQAFYKEHGFVRVGEHVYWTGNQADTDHILLKEI
jgi:ribosomal protein S18 acetylase RimI-like enzyme